MFTQNIKFSFDYIKTQLFYSLDFLPFFFQNLSVMIYSLHTYGKAGGLKK